MINSFKRYEKKFLISKAQYAQLLPILLQHMEFDNNCINGKTYHIRNLYLDDESNTLVHASVLKPDFKEKMRIRAYGSPEKNEKYFFEIKRKFEGIVTKRRIIVSEDELQQLIKTHNLPKNGNDYNYNQILKEIEYFLLNYSHIIPRIFISYDRVAFFDKEDKNFRVSFDTNIHTRREPYADITNENYEYSLLSDDEMLMEVKITSSYPLWFAKAISTLGLHHISFSKVGSEYKHSVLTNALNKKVDSNVEIVQRGIKYA